MKTIYKFPLQVTGEQVLWMPGEATPLCVEVQNGTPTLWVEVNRSSSKPGYNQLIFMFGTGFDIPDTPMQYLDTVQLGEYVWHFYRALTLPSRQDRQRGAFRVLLEVHGTLRTSCASVASTCVRQVVQVMIQLDGVDHAEIAQALSGPVHTSGFSRVVK